MTAKVAPQPVRRHPPVLNFITTPSCSVVMRFDEAPEVYRPHDQLSPEVVPGDSPEVDQSKAASTGLQDDSGGKQIKRGIRRCSMTLFALSIATIVLIGAVIGLAVGLVLETNRAKQSDAQLVASQSRNNSQIVDCSSLLASSGKFYTPVCVLIIHLVHRNRQGGC